VGFGAAAELLVQPQAEQERARIRDKRDMLLHLLDELPWPVSLNGPTLKDRHPGNANIRFEGFSASDLLAVLQPKLAASTGSACASGISEPSHVLRALGLTHDQALASMRVCIGRYTNDTDIQESVHLIAEALSKMSHEGLRNAG